MLNPRDIIYIAFKFQHVWGIEVGNIEINSSMLLQLLAAAATSIIISVSSSIRVSTVYKSCEKHKEIPPVINPTNPMCLTDLRCAS